MKEKIEQLTRNQLIRLKDLICSNPSSIHPDDYKLEELGLIRKENGLAYLTCKLSLDEFNKITPNSVIENPYKNTHKPIDSMNTNELLDRLYSLVKEMEDSFPHVEGVITRSMGARVFVSCFKQLDKALSEGQDLPDKWKNSI